MMDGINDGCGKSGMGAREVAWCVGTVARHGGCGARGSKPSLRMRVVLCAAPVCSTGFVLYVICGQCVCLRRRQRMSLLKSLRGR